MLNSPSHLLARCRFKKSVQSYDFFFIPTTFPRLFIFPAATFSHFIINFKEQFITTDHKFSRLSIQLSTFHIQHSAIHIQHSTLTFNLSLLTL